MTAVDSRLRGNDGDTVVREIPAYAGMTLEVVGMEVGGFTV